MYIEDINSNGIDIYETDYNERKYYDSWCFNGGENLSDAVEVLNDNERTIRELLDDCVKLAKERDRYKKALEEIASAEDMSSGITGSGALHIFGICRNGLINIAKNAIIEEV